MKTLCKKVDKASEKPEKYAQLVNHPVCFCERCGRAANDTELVCKPIKIKKEKDKKDKPNE